MRVLVTGATGFIGRNLIKWLSGIDCIDIDRFHSTSSSESLRLFTSRCEFVFHLAAVHRPADEAEFILVNVELTELLLDLLRSNCNHCPVLLSSSIQAGDGTAYGTSKLAAEDALKAHSGQYHSRAIIYRLTNTFGRYARPNQHSVVATFCYNIARDIPISIHDPERNICLCYVDDIIESFIEQLKGFKTPDADGFYRLPEELTYAVTLQELAEKLYQFKADLRKGIIITPRDSFSRRLFTTYLNYIPAE